MLILRKARMVLVHAAVCLLNFHGEKLQCGWHLKSLSRALKGIAWLVYELNVYGMMVVTTDLVLSLL